MLSSSSDAEVVGREMRREGCRHPAHGRDRGSVCIYTGYVVARAKEVDEIPALAAPGIEDPHAGRYPAAQQLIEQVDVDVAELRSQVHGSSVRFISMAL